MSRNDYEATPLSSEEEIHRYYHDRGVAQRYIAQRFESELNSLLHERQVAMVQRWIDTIRPEKILEIAPGPGRVTRDIVPSGDLICLEFNKNMIAEGRECCANKTHFIQGNAFQLPFYTTFDLVYSFRFLRHFHRTDRGRLYAQIRQVLRTGGYCLFDAVNQRVSEPIRRDRPAAYPVYDKLYEENELRNELQEEGFDDIRLEPVQRRFRWQYWSQVFLGPRSNWLNRSIIRGLEALPSPDGLEWIVACRRV